MDNKIHICSDPSILPGLTFADSKLSFFYVYGHYFADLLKKSRKIAIYEHTKFSLKSIKILIINSISQIKNKPSVFITVQQIHHHHHSGFTATSFVASTVAIFIFLFNLKCYCTVLIHVLYSNVILYCILLCIFYKCSTYRSHYIAALPSPLYWICACM